MQNEVFEKIKLNKIDEIVPGTMTSEVSWNEWPVMKFIEKE